MTSIFTEKRYMSGAVVNRFTLYVLHFVKYLNLNQIDENIIYLFLLTLIVRSQPISENLAFRKVMENLKGSIPESYVREAFSHKDLKIHKIIPERFARPYEKQTWEKYRKIFVKESRISSGAIFYNENLDVINTS